MLPRRPPQTHARGGSLSTDRTICRGCSCTGLFGGAHGLGVGSPARWRLALPPLPATAGNPASLAPSSPTHPSLPPSPRCGSLCGPELGAGQRRGLGHGLGFLPSLRPSARVARASSSHSSGAARQLGYRGRPRAPSTKAPGTRGQRRGAPTGKPCLPKLVTTRTPPSAARTTRHCPPPAASHTASAGQVFQHVGS